MSSISSFYDSAKFVIVYKAARFGSFQIIWLIDDSFSYVKAVSAPISSSNEMVQSIPLISR